MTANDLYELFVGEIGTPRREFLYVIPFWEARRILRGYKRRNVLEYQMLRICAYSSHFAFRENEKMLSPDQWLPLYFDKYDENDTPPISDEDIADLKNAMSEINSMMKCGSKAQ
jgi:hypothetical protein